MGDTTVVTLPAGTTSYVPGLQTDQTIYWRVDEKLSDPNTARGAIWSFETVKQTPIITDQPDSTRVHEGESATFSVAASSSTAMSYQWYKVGTGAIGGATSNMLTIDDVGCFRNPAGPATYYNGLLDEVRMYNYALSLQEVAHIEIVPFFSFIY